jgi:hypothetical protein
VRPEGLGKIKKKSWYESKSWIASSDMILPGFIKVHRYIQILLWV